MQTHTYLSALVLIIAVLLLGGCFAPRERTEAEVQLTGTWVSEGNSTVFEFSEGGSFQIDTGSERMAGQYRSLNEDEQDTLANQQFLLDPARITLQFSETGETFQIDQNVHGDPVDATWQRANETNTTESSGS